MQKQLLVDARVIDLMPLSKGRRITGVVVVRVPLAFFNCRSFNDFESELSHEFSSAEPRHDYQNLPS
jgi:hypothetical protein